MCLTGVDYFSTLGYQPGIAALAAGALSPIATVILVLLTLSGRCPSTAGSRPRARTARARSPCWNGCCRSGRASSSCWSCSASRPPTSSSPSRSPPPTRRPTSWRTRTCPAFMHGQELAITIALVALLGAVFLRGFTEAIGVAVALVGAYLALNLVVIAVSFWHVSESPHVIGDWTHALTTEHGNPFMMVAVALIVFPKLALGLSGFETGVAVMPPCRGRPGDTRDDPAGRIRQHQEAADHGRAHHERLPDRQQPRHHLAHPGRGVRGGRRGQRARACLPGAPRISATASERSTTSRPSPSSGSPGASAMAGLLNLIPRYLPRYGMAPEWAARRSPARARAHRHRLPDHLDLRGRRRRPGRRLRDRRAGADHLGRGRGHPRRPHGPASAGSRSPSRVITLALRLHHARQRRRAARRRQDRRALHRRIVAVSLVSRLPRAFELRTTRVELDRTAQMFLRDCARRRSGWSPTSPTPGTAEEYRQKIQQIVEDNDLPRRRDLIFVEVTITDPSDFETRLEVHGAGAARRVPGAHRGVAERAERPGRAAAGRPRPHRRAAAHLLRVDRGQPGHQPAPIPALRASARSRPSRGRCCGAPSQTPAPPAPACRLSSLTNKSQPGFPARSRGAGSRHRCDHRNRRLSVRVVVGQLVHR